MSRCVNNRITAFEVCSINAINYLNNNNDYYKTNKVKLDKRQNLFPSEFALINNNLNSNIRDINNEFIYKYDKNKKDLCYEIDNQYLINCSILQNSPFYTYNKTTNRCEFIPNFELPNNFSYIVDTSNISIYNNLQQDEDYFKFKYEKNIPQSYCEDKWYDWIITPNYHFGNKYEKDFGEFSKLDVKKCYKPCGLNQVPYVKDDKTRVCINKTYALNGLIQNKLDFSPVALINLIGNTKQTLGKLYKNIYNANSNYYENAGSIYVPNKTYTNKINESYFNENNNEVINAYNEMTNMIKSILNKSQTIDNPNFYNYDKYKDIITYKNPNFNENDPELLTLKGMNSSKMLTDEILIHTFYLSYYYQHFINKGIYNLDNYFIKEGGEEIFDINKNINDNPFNITKNLKQMLNENDRKTIHRLTNILYKAINICYDNKSDFSINLIILTKQAFKNPKNSSILTDLYLTEGLIENENFNMIISEYSYDKIYGNGDGTNTGAGAFIKDKITENTTDISKYNTKTDYNKNIEKIISNINKDYNIILFGEEYNEYKSKCPLNEFYDNGVCKNCKDFCTNNCGNIACKNFCPNVCKDETTGNNNDKSRCGVIKKNKDNNKEKIENGITTPVDYDSNHMPNLSKLLKILIKITFAIIFLYICYMFYDLFGEAMLSFYNMFYYLVLKVGLLLGRIGSFLYSLTGSENSFNSGEAEKIRTEIVYDNAKGKLNRLGENIAKIMKKNK